MAKTVIIDPYPRTVDLIFRQEDFKRLEAIAKIYTCKEGRMPSGLLEKYLPQASAIIGQPELSRKRLEMAKKLKAIINVEGNFLPNIDYEYCFQRGIHVLSTSVVFGQAVAEMVLGFALCLARGIPDADKLFKEGKEIYGRQSNEFSFLISKKEIGIIGFGNIGRALIHLLRPFDCTVRVYDPWLPDNYLLDFKVIPMSLEGLLKTSRIVFVLAGATAENRSMLGEKELKILGKGSIIILASRASLVDFKALTERLKKGDIKAAIDVFPEEPFPKNHPIRQLNNVILSAHRAGSIFETYKLMGDMVVDDLKQIFNGLPPVRLQKANKETVSKLSSKPIDK